MSNNQINHKVPLSGRLSYGLTDGCGNLLYCIIGSYLLYFYTDVFGLSVATAGAILLFTKCERKAPKFIYGDISSLKNNDSISLFFIVLYF